MGPAGLSTEDAGTQPGRRERGFTLVEIVVVIAILGVLLTMLAAISSSIVGQQRREATRQRLATVETALTVFVSQNLRLPCPADGRVAGTNANAGLEAISGSSCNVGGSMGSQQHGVVPWRALGLSEQDVTDGWGNRLTYRVSTAFIVAPSMNMTYCDPGGSNTTALSLASPGGYCDPTCVAATFPGSCTKPSTVTAGRGLRVRNLAGGTVMDETATPSTGAAYLVISHGENGAGSYSNLGVLQAASSTPSGTDEAKNNADLVLQGQYFDDFPSYTAGSMHFDDVVMRPTILAVATKANLGPRAH